METHNNNSFYIQAKWSGGKEGVNRTFFKAFVGRQRLFADCMFHEKEGQACMTFAT